MTKIYPKLLRIKNFVQHKIAKKPSKANEPILILFVVAILTATALAGVLGYQFGKRQGRHALTVLATDYKGANITVQDVQNIRLENDLLKSEISTLIQERDISLNNLTLLREDLRELKAENTQLTNLNQALINTTQPNGEPAVVDMQINALENNTFDYRFDILIPSQTEVNFIPRITLINATNMVEIPIKPSVYHTKGLVTIRGKFVMPDKFTPSQLRLGLSLNNQHTTKLYNWKVSR